MLTRREGLGREAFGAGWTLGWEVKTRWRVAFDARRRGDELFGERAGPGISALKRGRSGRRSLRLSENYAGRRPDDSEEPRSLSASKVYLPMRATWLEISKAPTKNSRG